MRIALGQLNMVWEDKELSLQKAETDGTGIGTEGRYPFFS